MTELRGFRRLLLLAVQSLLSGDMSFGSVFDDYSRYSSAQCQGGFLVAQEQSVYSKISIYAQISRSSKLSPYKPPISHCSQSMSPSSQKNYTKTTLLNKLAQEVQKIYFHHFGKSFIPNAFRNEQQFGLFVAGVLTLQAFHSHVFGQSADQHTGSSQFSLQKLLTPLYARNIAKAVLAIASQIDRLNLQKEFNFIDADIEKLQKWLGSAFGVIAQQSGSEKATPTNDESIYGDISEELIFYDAPEVAETRIEAIAKQIGITGDTQVKRETIMNGKFEDPFSKKRQGRKLK